MSSQQKARLLCALSLVFAVVVLGDYHSQAQQAALKPDVLAGLRLRTIGPAAMSGRIIDFAVVERDTFTFYVASATGGVWKTTNNGVTFTPVFEREGTHSVGDVELSQVNPNIVWVGTGERFNRQSGSWGDGVYKSTDAGKTWKNMGLEDSGSIGRILIHPRNPDVVYVAAMGHLWGPNKERGLYKTVDGGATWQQIIAVDENTGVCDVAMDSQDPNILYAAAYQRQRKPFGFHGGGPGSALLKSTDGGKTWRKLSKGLPEGDKGRIGISVYRKDPRIVYCCVEQGFRYTASISYDKALGGVYRSEDKGETWTFMNTWNPRPNYGSQIAVDPNDDQRIYMVSFSYSDDGGKTFKGRHGDDRFVWVDPNNSRHLMLGYDQGMAHSYDRGQTWLFIDNLPVSQFYHIGVDMRKPYWIYGGIQDNGDWAGPSATYRSEGVLNEDWVSNPVGDGFINLIHPTDQNTLFLEGQYLGLFRLNIKTRERRDIRPDNPRGIMEMPRRNWDAWGPGLPEPELGNAMSPGNWDAPFLTSHHNPNTLYAGTNKLWKTTDSGNSWTSLGDLTTGVNRRELLIMGQRANEYTASLDDGAPYYPTISAIAESPIRPGLLYVGTDDGNLQVSLDDGRHWENVVGRVPGLPKSPWIHGIEASRHHEGTVYVAINNYRDDDYANYLYKSTDYGQTWTSIVNDIPPRRVLRVVREDPKNPNLLYVGAELGFYISIDGGQHWVELKNNMPTAAFYDMAIHPRDNDLVLATHGRGIWILDSISALQELTPAVLASEAHLFSVRTAEAIRYSGEKGRAGTNFRGENPPNGAIIDYYLRQEAKDSDLALTIFDSAGTKIIDLKPGRAAGINRVVWDLRYPKFLAGERAPDGPFVVPDVYTARLTLGTRTYDQTFLVKEDPRLDVPIEDQRAWTTSLLAIADLYRTAQTNFDEIHPVYDQMTKLAVKDPGLDEAKELDRMYDALVTRLGSLYGNVSSWTGALTADQQSQMAYFAEMLKKLDARKEAFMASSTR